MPANHDLSMLTFKEHYQQVAIPALQEQFGYKNRLAAPRVIKAVVNVGISSGLKDTKVLESVKETLRMITGQQPVERKARKSISNFKIRQGQVVGLSVTLRGSRMNDFLDRLVHLAFPRVRDFRGLKTTMVDGRGNLTVGFRESVAFPEVRAGETERQHGLEVTVVTNARKREEGLELLRLMGFPFSKS